MYTQKMYDALRRDNAGKQNLINDLLDEIDRLRSFWNTHQSSEPEMEHMDTCTDGEMVYLKYTKVRERV